MHPWDGSSVDYFEIWSASRAGQVLLNCTRLAVENFISPWPRRGRRLLDIGCGTGSLLHFFWECGFDVTGLDISPDMLAAARRKLGPHAFFQLGSAECLPFDDHHFDYAALVFTTEFCKDPLTVLKEARRISRYGMIFGFYNGCLCSLKKEKTLWPWYSKEKTPIFPHLLSKKEMQSLSLKAGLPKPARTGSILPGPCFFLEKSLYWKWYSCFVYPFSLGNIVFMRFDFEAPAAVIPLYSTAVQTS